MAYSGQLIAPDLRKFIDGTPGEGFLEWCEAVAARMANPRSVEERVMARILRAIVVATIESANAARERDGADGLTVAILVARSVTTAGLGAVMSVMKDDMPTAELRTMMIRELDVILGVMAPGETIGAAD